MAIVNLGGSVTGKPAGVAEVIPMRLQRLLENPRKCLQCHLSEFQVESQGLKCVASPSPDLIHVYPERVEPLPDRA